MSGGPRTYKTHDNYGRPLRVTLSASAVRDAGAPTPVRQPAGRVTIRRRLADGDGRYGEPFWAGDVEEAFLGISRLNPMTGRSRGFGAAFDGNTLLLRLRGPGHPYVFVGADARRFEALAPIVDYQSPVGLNDIPYPFAIDELGNRYLLGEGVVLTDAGALANYDDPYAYYYKHAALAVRDPGADAGMRSEDSDSDSCEEPAFYEEDGSAIALSHQADPAGHYDALVDDAGGLFVRYPGHAELRPLTREDYVRLVREHGEARGFRAIPFAPLAG